MLWTILDMIIVMFVGYLFVPYCIFRFVCCFGKTADMALWLAAMSLSVNVVNAADDRLHGFFASEAKQ